MKRKKKFKFGPHASKTAANINLAWGEGFTVLVLEVSL